MKSSSIRRKITLWFSLALFLLAILIMAVVIGISNAIITRDVQFDLVKTVESNMHEIEYHNSIEAELLDDNDLYFNYKDGYLELDDDFLDEVNGVYSALYDSSGNLLYGDDTIRLNKKIANMNRVMQSVSINGKTWYVYESKLTAYGLNDLWLRGMVSKDKQASKANSIIRLSIMFIPILTLLSGFAGYIISGKMLLPIRQIGNAADNIRQGQDLSKRIDLGNGSDELHQLADSFNGMFDRLESSFRFEQQFTSDVSHELRTPVAVITSQCELALESQMSKKEYIEAIQLISRQSSKMSSMINDMLTIARIEQTEGSITMETVDLSSVCAAVCEDMSLVQIHNISLNSKIENGISIIGNSDLLSSLLTNLITNAYKFGKEKGHIIVKLEVVENMVFLSVEDDGVGIPKDQLGTIWNRFYRVDSSRSGEGTGLGLPIVKEIASIHGGVMQVESELGEGCKFTFIMDRSTNLSLI